MFKGILSASAIMLSFSAIPAHAICAEANVIGTWKLYSVNNTSGQVGWAKCTMVVVSGGKVKSGSTCSNDLGQSTPIVGNVHLTSASSCTFTGSITYTLNGQVNQVNEATMGEDKRTVTGVGSGAGPFLFTMTKIR